MPATHYRPSRVLPCTIYNNFEIIPADATKGRSDPSPPPSEVPDRTERDWLEVRCVDQHTARLAFLLTKQWIDQKYTLRHYKQNNKYTPTLTAPHENLTRCPLKLCTFPMFGDNYSDYESSAICNYSTRQEGNAFFRGDGATLFASTLDALIWRLRSRSPGL